MKYQYKVITSWGISADDVLLIVTFPDGMIEYIDFSANDAEIIGGELIKAAKEARELETGYFDAELGAWILEQLLALH